MRMYYKKIFHRFAPILAWLTCLSCALVALPAVQAQNLSAEQVQQRPVKYSQARVYITDRSDIFSLERI